MKDAVSRQPSAVGLRPSNITTRVAASLVRPFDHTATHRAPHHHTMRDFRQLRVWQQAHRLTIAVYHATARFPKDEVYGLRAQIRRAASSIGANLAEASGRHHDADQARFCQIAMGSACELQNHLILARDLHFIDDATSAALEPTLVSLKRMLTVFIRKLTADRRRPTASLLTADRRRPTAPS